MTKRFKINTIGEKLIVQIHNPLKGWGAFMFAAYLLSIILGTVLLVSGVLYDMFTNGDGPSFFMFIILAIFAIYYLMIRQIFKSMNEFETIIFDGENLEIRNGKFYKVVSRAFKIDEIKDLKHIDEKERSEHPLSTDSFDYLGFQTEQKTIEQFHKDDRVQFIYNGADITFGKDLMSWELDDLINILQTKASLDLSGIRY